MIGSRASLIIEGGVGHGKTIELSGRPVTMGRRSDNDVVVDEDTVSRRHALVMETPSGFVLMDLSSTNGTYVNRIKVQKGEALLKHGDRITLAGSEVGMLFQHAREDTARMGLDSPRTGAIDVAGREEFAEPTPSHDLHGKEGDLLRFLESKKGSAVSRDEIARFVWPELPAGSAVNVEIDKAIEAVRAEIEDAPRDPVRLITVGEFGYLLV